MWPQGKLSSVCTAVVMACHAALTFFRCQISTSIHALLNGNHPRKCQILVNRCRLFLRKLKDTLRIPVLALVDSDPYGLKILSVYMKGKSSEPQQVCPAVANAMSMLPKA